MEPGAKAGKIWPYDDLPDVSSADSKKGDILRRHEYWLNKTYCMYG